MECPRRLHFDPLRALKREKMGINIQNAAEQEELALDKEPIQVLDD